MLTDVLVKKSKPKEKDYRLNDGDGLSLLIKKSGSKLWRYRRKIDGKEVFLGLGSYPEVSIQDARNKAKEHNEDAAKGIPPAPRKKRKLPAPRPLKNWPGNGLPTNHPDGQRVTHPRSSADWRRGYSRTSAT